jgi:hypothetical protein
MKYKDWSDFLAQCSGIGKIMSRPKDATHPPKKDVTRMNKIMLKEELSDEDNAFIQYYEARERRAADPELSSTAIKYLIGRYAWEKYGKRTPSYGFTSSPAEKGNRLELEAIEMLSQLDKKPYGKSMEKVKNDFLIGQCDVFHKPGRKIMDVKVSWNINKFLGYHESPLERTYWYQMQGYMELYDADEAEVCFVLVNTPQDLVIREKEKLNDKYLRGEITRDKYNDDSEILSFALNYNNMPLKRRVIRQKIERYKDIMPLIYNNVLKCRLWLNEFEKTHLLNKTLHTLPEHYINNNAKEDNTDPDS